MKNNQTTIKYHEALEDLYIADLERQWRKALPRYSEKQWLEIFPEARGRVRDLIGELESEKSEFLQTIKKELNLIKQKITDKFSQWFWREVIKYIKIPRLIEVERHLIRLKLAISTDKKREKNEGFHITDRDIQQAKEIPIIEIALPYLEQDRQVGENYVALCPFHQERQPSFYLYTISNSFYCYGCKAGGDIITLTMKLHNLSFREAVQFLLKR